ncbi:aldo/keto reductase [Dermacoccaceae bacterium W4C1]
MSELDLTELDLTGLVLGTMTFGDTADAQTAGRMLDVAAEAGVSLIDTANGYAGGATEEMLAGLLAERPGKFAVATKAGMPHPDAGSHALLSAPALRACVEGSLSRLGLERVELFYLHQPDPDTALEETLGAVAELVKEGKIGALGVSNFAAWQIAEINHVADRVGAPRPVVAQQLYNLIARRLDEEYTRFASSTGLATMVYNPLGGGLLTGRHTFSERPTEGRFGDSRLAEMYAARYWDQDLFDAVEELSGIAADAGMPLSEMAIRWLVTSADVSSILLGGSKVEHLQSNIAAASRGPLDPELVEKINAVGLRLRGPMPAYNR